MKLSLQKQCTLILQALGGKLLLWKKESGEPLFQLKAMDEICGSAHLKGLIYESCL